MPRTIECPRDDESEADCLRALRVSLGVLGVLSEVTLQLVPTFDVERREYALGTGATLEALPDLVAGNRSFDFYWYPRRDATKLRLVNPFDGGTPAPEGARLLVRAAGAGHIVIPTHSGIPHPFEECEYAVPAEAGPACFGAVRERVLRRWRHLVGWRVLYRTVAADDAWLSAVPGYRIAVAARRVRSLRVNDLIFPEAVRLEAACGRSGAATGRWWSRSCARTPGRHRLPAS